MLDSKAGFPQRGADDGVGLGKVSSASFLVN